LAAAETVMMSVSDKVDPDRTRLNFAKAVTERFAFLGDLGFSVTELLPTIVRYRKGDVEADVYHGRQSYELGFDVERHGVRYSLSDLISAVDPVAAEQYRNFAARTQDGITKGLTLLAELVKRHSEPALRGDPGRRRSEKRSVSKRKSTTVRKHRCKGASRCRRADSVVGLSFL
jgi:hypothetical protein